MTPLTENLERLEAAIEQACRRAGRSAARRRADGRLEDLSRQRPSLKPPALGLRSSARIAFRNSPRKSAWTWHPFADAARSPRRPGFRVHLIGHLQSNKSARAAELFDAIDSLDSLRLAERLNEAARQTSQTASRAARSEAESGRDKAKASIRTRPKPRSCSNAFPASTTSKSRGLMTIAPWGVAEEVTRACFRSLREWRDRWAAAHPRLYLDVLSMGMSGDFPHRHRRRRNPDPHRDGALRAARKPGALPTGEADPA